MIASAVESEGRRYLEVYPVELLVLVLDLGAHVGSHVAQVADHGADLLHVLLHLLLAVVVRDPEREKREGMA